MKTHRFILPLMLLLGLAACSHAPKQVRVKEMADPNNGLAYGQIILPGKDWYMRHVMFQRVGKVYGGLGLQAIGEKIHVMPDGRFVAENLKPGKYMLGGFVIGDLRNSLGKSALNYQIEVKPGGIHYFGSYKYVTIRNENMFRPGQFDLEKASSDKLHAELLSWLNGATAGTQWQPKIQRELGKYRRYLGASR